MTVTGPLAAVARELRPVDAYLEAARALWPVGPSPCLAKRGERVAADVSFGVVPNPDSVRLIVPIGNSAAAARSLLRFSSGLGVRERTTRTGLAAALRAGGARLLSHRIAIPTASGSLLETLSDEVYAGEGCARRQSVRRTPADQDVSCSMSLGPVRANRKPVLQLFAADGRTLGFAKVGLAPAVRPFVEHEHATLRQLGAVRLPPVVDVPKVHGYHAWSGLPVLAMSALPTPLVTSRVSWRKPPWAEMDAFARTFDHGTNVMTETAWWRNLLGRRVLVCDAEQRERFMAATDSVTDSASSTVVPLGAWHGDWTPWNMAWHRGRLQLWDWERFETGVPIGLDRLHYAVNSAFVTLGRTRAAVEHGLAAAGVDGDRPGSEGHILAAAYLCAILDRYLTAEVSAVGAGPRRVIALLDALDGWVRR